VQKCRVTLASPDFRREPQQVLAIGALGQRLGQRCERLTADITLPERNLLWAGDLETLPAFNHMDEFGSLEQAFMRAGIQPGDAPPQLLDSQGAARQVSAVDVGNLQLAARRRLQARRNLNDGVVVEIKPRDGIVGFRPLRLFLQRYRLARPIELNHAIAFRIGDRITEDDGARGQRRRLT